jgi:two-component system LytT family response regulator
MSAVATFRLNGRRALAAATVAAVLVGAVTGLQAYVARVGSADTLSLGYAVQNRTLAALAWVLVGTAVVSAARRWPLVSATWRRSLPVHLAGALAAGLAVNAILHTLLWLLGADDLGGADVPAIVVRDAIDHAHLNAVVYAAVLAVVYWVDSARSTAPAPVPTMAAATASNGDRYAARLTARRRDTLTVVAVDDVDWIEGADDYACLHVGARRHLTDDRLRELEGMLDPARFVRVHRSALVNLGRVREIEEGRWGDAVAVLRDGTRVRVSRTRRAALMAALGPTP